MFNFFWNLQLYHSPDDSGGGAADGDFSADMAVLNEPLSESQEDIPPASERVPSQPELGDLAVIEPEPEDDEEEEEDDTEKEDEEEEPVIAGKPSIGAIKKEFPGIFKKFPELKNSFFRDGEFSKAFSTPEEAHQAATKAENFDLLSSSLGNGSPELLMKELSENNPRAFKEVAKNWLPELRKLDDKAYAEVTEPVLEELIFLAFKHGQKTGDKNLAMSARHLANFVFANGGEIPDITAKRNKEPNPAEVQLQREREEWQQTRFKEADSEIFNFVTKSLDQTIRQGLDPAGTMPERMKASIVQDVINEMNSLLSKDPVHGRKMQGLWRRASGDSFSRQSKEAIATTYLSGARPLLRDIRNRIRAEYSGSAPSRKVPNGVPPQAKRTFEGSSKRVDQRRDRLQVLDPKKIDYNRTSDLDILMGKVVQKGQR